jgi:hypothetical protein
MAPIIKAQPAASEANEGAKTLLSGAKFDSLFSAEEQAEILAIVGSVLIPEAKPQTTAKIYDFAAYRK